MTRCLPTGPPWLVASLLILAVNAVPSGVGADPDAEPPSDPQRCEQAGDCAVESAICVRGFCRLARAQLLFAGAPNLDAIELLEPADRARTSAQPMLRWTYPEGIDLLATAIFRTLPVSMRNRPDRLANPQDAIWLWHSNLDDANPTAAGARFVEGRSVSYDEAHAIDDDAIGDGPPDPLLPGVYYWAVWAWNGLELSRRSEIRRFVVGDYDLTGQPCSTHCRRSDDTHRCLEERKYCVIACASDRDCYGDSICDLTTHPDADQAWGICRTGPAECSCDPVNERCDPEMGLCYDLGLGDTRDGSCAVAHGADTMSLYLLALLFVGLGLRHRLNGSPRPSRR